MTARGIRNNNPGNLRTGPSWVGVTGNDGSFDIFDTPEHGIRALAKNLIGYQAVHGDRTIRQIINRWAPPVENDTGAYVNVVAAFCGVDPDADYLLTPQGLFPLVQAIIQHENGSLPYSTEQIQTAIGLALGASESSAPASTVGTAPTAPSSPVPPARPETPARTPPGTPTTTQRPSMLPALLLPLLNVLASALPVLGPLFGSGEVAQRNQKLGAVAIEAATQAVGATNAQEALEKIRDDKEAAALAQAAILALPEVGALLEAGGGGIKGARDAASAADSPPFWKQMPFAVSLMLMPLVYYATVMVLGGYSEVTNETKAFVIGMIFGGALSGIIAYTFGTTNSSARKDQIIAGR